MAALDNLRVLDLSTGVAPAMTTMLLADFGANVVRVEHESAGRYGPTSSTWSAISAALSWRSVSVSESEASRSCSARRILSRTVFGCKKSSSAVAAVSRLCRK